MKFQASKRAFDFEIDHVLDNEILYNSEISNMTITYYFGHHRDIFCNEKGDGIELQTQRVITPKDKSSTAYQYPFYCTYHRYTYAKQ